jgi:hypothetical protein
VSPQTIASHGPHGSTEVGEQAPWPVHAPKAPQEQFDWQVCDWVPQLPHGTVLTWPASHSAF